MTVEDGNNAGLAWKLPAVVKLQNAVQCAKVGEMVSWMELRKDSSE